jgi:hypothetical protein
MGQLGAGQPSAGMDAAGLGLSSVDVTRAVDIPATVVPAVSDQSGTDADALTPSYTPQSGDTAAIPLIDWTIGRISGTQVRTRRARRCWRGPTSRRRASSSCSAADRRSGCIAGPGTLGRRRRHEERAVIDHLVYGTPDLPATVRELSERFGFPLSEGGQHLGSGTRNFLADLGEGRYLEVVGPDWEQPHHEGPRMFPVDSLGRARLLTWAARVGDLDRAVRTAADAGVPVGEIRSMRRASADAAPISWRMTPPLAVAECHGLVPFLVQWTDSAHPSDRAARGAHLAELHGFTPEVAAVQERLAAVGAHLDLTESDRWGLRAVLETPRGHVVLE